MTGEEFVHNLHKDYGLLEAYRIASVYLETPNREVSETETKFREEVRLAMWELDQI